MPVKFEKYLSSQRNNLDVESPDDDVIWKGISGKLNYKSVPVKRLNRNVNLIRIRNIAAVAIIIFSLGYITNDIINSKNQELTLSSIDKELGLREQQYKSLVRLKTEEVREFAGSDDLIISQLFEEIKTLDKISEQALSDLGELGDNEKAISTIFRAYEQKIRLLELIILETNKINSHENIEKILL